MTPDSNHKQEPTGQVSHRDLQRAVDGFGAKLDAYMSAHTMQHASEQKSFGELIVQSAVAAEREQRMEHMVAKLEVDVDHLTAWRSEVRGMTRLIQFAIGSSILGAVISFITLFAMLRGGL